MSIKMKYVITSFALIIIIAIFMTLFWYKITYMHAEKVAIKYANDILKKTNNSIEDMLKDTYFITTIISMEKDIVINPLIDENEENGVEYIEKTKKLRNLMSHLTSLKPYINGVMVFNNSGEYYVNGTIMTYKEMISRQWSEKLFNSNSDKIIINPHNYDIYLEDTNNYRNKVISIARPIYNLNENIGYVVADINCNNLINIINNTLDSLGTYSIIDNEKDSYIIEASKENIIKDNDIKNIKNKFTNDKGHFTTKINNKNYLIIYENFSFTDWTSIYVIPEDELLIEFNEGIKVAILFSIFICLLGMLIIYIISHLLTRNILKLNYAMSKIDKDNLDVEIDIKSKDEVGDLALQFNLLSSRIKQLIKDIKISERKKKESQIKALQSQINPHFLMNTLNTIKFLSVMQGVNNITEVSDALSSIMHMYLDQRNIITINEEIEYLINYLEIQKYKYHDNFSYNINIEENCKKYKVLKLIIQPLVENSLIHGIQSINKKGIILVKVYEENGLLKIIVQDNGIGIDENKIAEIYNNQIDSKSIGINNIRSRIKLFYGSEYDIKYNSQPYIQTLAELTLPIILGDNDNE